MEPQEKSLTEMHGCDESKCVSRGRSNLFNNSFTCYGDDGTFYPMMCADGFLPMIAEDEPPYIAADWWGKNSTVSYFTCCPPQHTTDVTRHCSDPITALNDVEANNDESADAICELQGTRKYSRQIKPRIYVPDSFLCCNNSTPTIGHVDEINSNITTTATDFLDDLDCLPYRNEYYDASKIRQNQVGSLPVISCDFSEGPEGDFVIPRLINASSGTYQCCKDGHALPPFVKDSAFKITLYPSIALFSVAAIISAVVAIGLLIPLLIQLKDGSYQQRSTRRRGLAPRYSTYNLYLVYLALADLVFCLFQIALHGTTINQTFDSRFYPGVIAPPQSIDSVDTGVETVITLSYVSTNFYINAVICYEVLVLLRASRRAHRINQPSLTKVNLQMGAACIIGTIVAVGSHFLIYGAGNAAKNENSEKSRMLSIQPILTFCMILTKTDARKYIWDLVTLSYLFGDCACRKDKALPVRATKNTGAQNTPQSSQRPRGVYAIAMTGAITGVTDNVADDVADNVADDVVDDVADDVADDGADDDIDANADVDAAI